MIFAKTRKKRNNNEAGFQQGVVRRRINNQSNKKRRSNRDTNPWCLFVRAFEWRLKRKYPKITYYKSLKHASPYYNKLPKPVKINELEESIKNASIKTYLPNPDDNLPELDKYK
jgi:hypothetical protein